MRELVEKQEDKAGNAKRAEARQKKKRDKAATPSSDTRHPKRGSSTTAPSGAHAAKKARK